MELLNKKIKMTNTKDKGKTGIVKKKIKDGIYRIRLDNGARTVVHEVEFEVVGD